MIVWVQSGTRCWIFVTAMAAGAAATAGQGRVTAVDGPGCLATLRGPASDG